MKSCVWQRRQQPCCLSLEAIRPSPQSTYASALPKDPDILDPTWRRTYVGRIVFSAFCDKLFDIDEQSSTSCRSLRCRMRRPTTARS
jgi:peptide/nickel transport system substrate-binding protein